MSRPSVDAGFLEVIQLFGLNLPLNPLENQPVFTQSSYARSFLFPHSVENTDNLTRTHPG